MVRGIGGTSNGFRGTFRYSADPHRKRSRRRLAGTLRRDVTFVTSH